MAYAGSFAHDVFVSYAEADNQTLDGAEGWVATFVARLRVALIQRLGGEAPAIYFGNNLQSNQPLDEILASVRRSALFLAVGSRAFIERQWTNLELNTFVSGGASPARIFLIECMPPWPDQKYPSPIENHRRLKFHAPTGQQSIDVPLSPLDDSARFNGLIHDLAQWVSEALRMLRVAPPPLSSAPLPPIPGAAAAPASGAVPTPAPLPAPLAAPATAGRRVLLAQVTDDLEDEAVALRRYLEQFGVRVLPAEPYPQGGAEFSAAFQADLTQSDIFVQLLGARAGRAPRDLPDGYSVFQHAKALERGLEVVQWRLPGLDTAANTNERYRQLLDGPHVVVSGLEAFKSLVKDAALRPLRPQPLRPQASQAFIDAEHRDLEVARQLQASFDEHAIPTVLPMADQSSAATRSDLEENLLESDVLVFVYGNSPPEWIRSQLRLYNKLRPRREVDPRALAICIVPPNTNPELGMSIPGSQVIDLRSGDFEPVRQFLRGVVQ